MTINNRHIHRNSPVYVIAEMSANHCQDLSVAIEIVRAAKRAGADAIKTQCFTPDSMTMFVDNDVFRVRAGLWKGCHLYSLYQAAAMPMEWHEILKKEAASIGLDYFATVYDKTSVDFMLQLGVPALKVSSFEITDLPLLNYIDKQMKTPVILSCGNATLNEVIMAVTDGLVFHRDLGNLALLACSSAYPASTDNLRLGRLRQFAEELEAIPGLSDHTESVDATAWAVAAGAKIIERHFCSSKSASAKSPDVSFSFDEHTFSRMVRTLRKAERALEDREELAPTELPSNQFRRSIFVSKKISAGELLTEENLRIIRPSDGLAPSRWGDICKQSRAARDLEAGAPLQESDLAPYADASDHIQVGCGACLNVGNPTNEIVCGKTWLTYEGPIDQFHALYLCNKCHTKYKEDR